jgi:Fe-S-cluster containining protein
VIVLTRGLFEIKKLICIKSFHWVTKPFVSDGFLFLLLTPIFNRVNQKNKDIITSAKQNLEAIKKLFRKWKQVKPKDLDQKFHEGHKQVFKKINCLECANCCKTTSPIFRDVDIKRISKYVRLKESHFIANYLKLDDENDYVLQQSPCAFLGPDNACSIYEFRPLACREYPHTDRKNMHQILDLTVENSLICPAVAQIVGEMVAKHP